MKCPDCNSRVDHSSLVSGPKGEEYYVCPNCELDLVHQMGVGKVMLCAAICLPIIWFVADYLVTILIGPIVSDALIIGIDAVEVATLAVSAIIAAAFIKHSTRLVRR